MRKLNFPLKEGIDSGGVFGKTKKACAENFLQDGKPGGPFPCWVLMADVFYLAIPRVKTHSPVQGVSGN